MRCLACDKRLNDRESTRKYHSTSSSFVDLCDRCFATISDDLPDVEEGEYPEDLPEDEEKDGGWDYQQRNNHGGE